MSEESLKQKLADCRKEIARLQQERAQLWALKCALENDISAWREKERNRAALVENPTCGG